MARPASDQPTPGELEILKFLWEHGPATVREVREALNRDQRRDRAYTTVMSLMNVMTEKGWLKRVPEGRAFRYRAAVDRQLTLEQAVGDLVGRVFDGAASSLVAHLLEHGVSDEELSAIQRTIREYQKRNKGEQGA